MITYTNPIHHLPHGFMPDCWVTAEGDYEWPSVIVRGIFAKQNEAIGDALTRGRQLVGALVNWGAGPLPQPGERLMVVWDVPGRPGFYPIYHHELPVRAR